MPDEELLPVGVNEPVRRTAPTITPEPEPINESVCEPATSVDRGPDRTQLPSSISITGVSQSFSPASVGSL